MERAEAAEVLIQVLVPKKLGTWIKDAADSEGRSTSAFVRRILTMHQEQQENPGGIIPMISAIKAWVMPHDQTWAHYEAFQGRNHTVMLERTSVQADGTHECRMHHAFSDPKNHNPFLVWQLRGQALETNLETGWIALEGSKQRWTVDYSVADDLKKGQMVLYLRPERRPTS